jgi:hypothetical protein
VLCFVQLFVGGQSTVDFYRKIIADRQSPNTTDNVYGMTAYNIIALSLHVIIPLFGLLYYFFLTKKMEKENVTDPPTTALFFVFATYGGLLAIILWTIFGLWGGLSSLTGFYLILVAPIAMGVTAFKLRQTRTISKYHNWTFLSGLLYFVIAPLTFGILLLVSKD